MTDLPDRPSPPARPERRTRGASELRPWLLFAGCVLIVFVLYMAQVVLIPVALALLLSFVLNPAATWLQRLVGRPAAVGIVVLTTLVALGGTGWVLARQASSLAADLPKYRQNIRTKVADVRGMTRGGSIEEVQSTIAEIQDELNRDQAPPSASRRRTTPAPQSAVAPVAPPGAWWNLSTWTTPLLAVTGTAALVTILVIFMLLEYRDLRARLLALIGRGYVANTTKAFEEAGARLSRYLLMQLLINVTYGLLVAGGLWVIGVPYPMLWGVLGTLLRFIPYVGPWIAAGAPTLLSLAVFPGWSQPLWTLTWFVGLELFTNMVLETLLYAGAAGVSQVALLVAVAFWTWLWGPMGLLLSTPLTVCLVVLGKHVPGLWALSLLIADTPALSPDAAHYQRLLAGDVAEAMELVEAYVRDHSFDEVYDGLLLPALNYAERDRRDGRISDEEEDHVVQSTRELLDEVPSLVPAQTATTAQENAEATDSPPDRAAAPPAMMPSVDATPAGTAGAAAVVADSNAPTTLGPLRPPVPVIGYALDARADEVALAMLAQLCVALPLEIQVISHRAFVSELVAALRETPCRVVVIADLPPNSVAKVRHLVKRLRQHFPGMRILVGRWAPQEFGENTREALIAAGASDVSTTLVGTRQSLRELVAVPVA